MEERSEHPDQTEPRTVYHRIHSTILGSRWRRYATFCGFAGIILFACLAWVYSYHLENQKGRRQAANAQTEYSKHEHDCILFSSLTERLECLIEKGKISHEQQHARQDLRAQQDIASATIVLMIAGVIGLAASVAGILLVYENLREMRKQSGIQKDVGENQSKAYGWAHKAFISFPSDEEPKRGVIRLPGTPNIRVQLLVRNDGETPALNVTAWATLRIFSSSGNALAPIKMEYEGAATKNPMVRVVPKRSEEPLWLYIPDSREFEPQNVFANALDPRNWAAKFGAHSFILEGIVQYRDVFDQWYHSAFKFVGSVKNDGEINPAFRSEEPEILFAKVEAPKASRED